jgi:hypothetical protein
MFYLIINRPNLIDLKDLISLLLVDIEKRDEYFDVDSQRTNFLASSYMG